MTMKSDHKLSDFPVSYFVLKVFDWIKWLSVIKLLSIFNCLRFIRPRSELTQEEIKSAYFTKRRGKAIEIYLLIWIIFELFSSILSCTLDLHNFLKILITVLIASRIIEIIQVTVNASIFDAINNRPDNLVASKARMVILSLINFFELVICFGIIYALNFSLLSSEEAFPKVSSFYFSTITQLTIGYGDLSPTSYLMIVASLQGLLGLLFVVLVFARFIAVLPKIDSLIDKEQV